MDPEHCLFLRSWNGRARIGRSARSPWPFSLTGLTCASKVLLGQESPNPWRSSYLHSSNSTLNTNLKSYSYAKKTQAPAPLQTSCTGLTRQCCDSGGLSEIKRMKTNAQCQLVLLVFASWCFRFWFGFFVLASCIARWQPMDYVSIQFSSLLYHITMLPLHSFGEFAQCNCLSGLINDLARAIWRWTKKTHYLRHVSLWLGYSLPGEGPHWMCFPGAAPWLQSELTA